MKLSEATKSGIALLVQMQQAQAFPWHLVDLEINDYCQLDEAKNDEHTREHLGHWFGHQNALNAGDQFFHFASDGTGGLYCLWFYPALVGEPPVIMLGSEGEATLFASCFTDFLQQTASGQTFYVSHRDEVQSWFDSEESYENEDAARLTQWQQAVENALGPTIESANTLAARAAHPSIKQWVEDRLD